MKINDSAYAQLANLGAKRQQFPPAAAPGHGDDAVNAGDQPGDLGKALLHYVMQADAGETILEKTDGGYGEDDVAEEAQADE